MRLIEETRASSQVDLDLLLIFHGMTARQTVELFKAGPRCPERCIEGAQRCCSFHYLCRHKVRKL